jgi:Tfp pilus assembly protein PilZ
MTTMKQPAGGAGAGRDRRRFPRYDVEIPVKMKRKGVDVRMMTADASRHGAFIRTDEPGSIRQLVQLTFLLPDHGPIDAMCMVARVLGPDSARGTGMGVDFFALSKQAKQKWERFVADLKARDASLGFDTHHTPTGSVALPPNLGVPIPAQGDAPPGMPEWLATTSVTGRITVRDKREEKPQAGVPLPPGVAEAANAALPPMPPVVTGSLLEIESGPPMVPPWTPPEPPEPEIISEESAAPPHPPDDEVGAQMAQGSVLMLRLGSRENLQRFIENEVERGGLFMKTPLVKELGDKVDIVLVHPESDEEFHLEGTVVRRVITGPADQRGLGIFFKALSPESHAKLVDFVDSGIEVVELGQIVSDRQLELEAAVAREPDSAEALEALGSYLLDEEGDLGGALTALTRALVLGPSQISIHASLARAYRKIGDQVKVRAHERVAEALMFFQDKLKIRMGVGDDVN